MPELELIRNKGAGLSLQIQQLEKQKLWSTIMRASLLLFHVAIARMGGAKLKRKKEKKEGK